MFKILSLKKYRYLKNAKENIREKCEELLELAGKRCQELQDDKEHLETERDNARAALCEYRTVLHDTREELCIADAERTKCKSLFADEVHKRLCLAEKVSSLEQTIKDLEFNLRTTEAELEKTKGQLPRLLMAERADMVRCVLTLLRRGVPQPDGTQSKDPGVLKERLEEDYLRYTHYSEEGEKENA